MGKIDGFLEEKRAKPPERDPAKRQADYDEVYLNFDEPVLKKQAARCMNCGVPFCHTGCPLGNLIPDWNHLIYTGEWREAIDRLHATNNFPEFTGRVCPAPCENACVLAINDDPVTIKQVEVSIVDHAWEQGWIVPEPPAKPTGRKVAIVGSGPAGLACAQQLARAGHAVTVYEHADRIGGLLRYGIPEFKMHKRLIDRRMAQMEAEGVVFRPNTNVGVDIPAEALQSNFDAVVLCGGATEPRDLSIDGRDLQGVHYAMDFLTPSNKLCEGDDLPPDQRLDAKGKKVVVIGGGDTGADCVATSLRQGAARVTQLEFVGEPPPDRAPDNPWPEWARIRRISYALKEGGEIKYAVSTKQFEGDGEGRLAKLHCVLVDWRVPEGGGRPAPVEIDGSDFEIEADLALLAIGYVGPEKPGLLTELGVKLTERGNVWTGEDRQTSVEGVFAAGDLRRGQSLVVTAIAEGRETAYWVDGWLMGGSTLPRPG